MQTIEAHTLDDPRLRVFAHLTNHQLRHEVEAREGVLVAETRWVVEAALEAGLACESVLVERGLEGKFADVLGRLPEGCPVFLLDSGELERLAGYRVTRGILACFRRPALPGMGELVARSRRLVVLEGLTDTSNVGAAFRSAAALGADGVVVAPSCADPFERRAARTGMGATFRVPWARASSPWPSGLFDALHAHGFTSVALALGQDTLRLGSAELGERLSGAGRLALLFGAEGYGLEAPTRAGADVRVSIPMAHGVDSLNVAASAAVALWELFARPGR